MTEAATTTATTTTTTTPPAGAGTPQEAAARLAELRADRGWGEKLLAKDAATVKEFHDLAAKATGGNDLDMLILAAPDLPDLNLEGQLSPKKVAGEIPALRESGLSDDVIRELLAGRQSTPPSSTR